MRRCRTASTNVDELPARTPSSRLTTPSRTSTSTEPRRKLPSPMPAAATASRDERDPAGGRPPDDPGGFLGEMMAVEDQLHDHVVAGERGAGDAGVAVRRAAAWR